MTCDADDSSAAQWIYDAATQDITARWVNTDGGKFNTPTRRLRDLITLIFAPAPVDVSLVYVTQALVLTGDYGIFSNTFGGSGEVVRCSRPRNGLQHRLPAND